METPHDQPSAADGSQAPAATAPVLTKPEIEKIQGLLESKTSDCVVLGLSLLESLRATRADYEAVWTDKVRSAVKKIADEWHEGGDATKAEYAVYSRVVVRPVMEAARSAFLAACGDASASAKPFIDLVEIPAGSLGVAVRITKPFRLGRTVVTQGQWRAVMGTEPWPYYPYSNCTGLNNEQCGDDFPAVFTSWHDVVLFCETLTRLERETGRLTALQSYRLPTEAEWEYACRAGTTTAYSFGDNPEQLAEYGWFQGNSGGKLHPVAQKKPNPWGLFDMHGNVWEWCSDWWSEDYYDFEEDDPQGPPTGTDRVTRGGSWHEDASNCGSADGDMAHEYCRLNSIGFRVVLSLE